MKKFWVILVFLFVVSFVVAQEMPDAGIGVEDVDKLKGAIEDYSPLSESGEVDFDKYKPFVTKADLRIKAINSWLDENVGWMRYIFNMKPAISWLFFINVYVILWFFVVLFLNSEGLWFFIEKKGGARAFGFGVFAILLVTRLYYGLATVFYVWLDYLWNVLFASSIWIAIIGFVMVLVLMFMGIAVIGPVLSLFARYKAEKAKRKQEMKMATSVEAVEALIDEVGKK